MSLHPYTAEKVRYRDRWEVNAASFEEQKCYEWMAECLAPYRPRRVLDIGCGTGAGMVALLKGSVERIVGVDENYPCLDAAAQRLRAEGFEASLQERIAYRELEDGRHDMLLSDGERIEMGSPATLVHADIFFWPQDEGFLRFLEWAAPFDAVTVWLAGTFGAREKCRDLDAFGFEEIGEYRHVLQRAAYYLANSVLVSGGVLQTVDRGASLEDYPGAIDEILRSHRTKAEGTQLVVESISSIPYREPVEGGIGMTPPRTGDAKPLKSDNREMRSVIAIRK